MARSAMKKIWRCSTADIWACRCGTPCPAYPNRYGVCAARRDTTVAATVYGTPSRAREGSTPYDPRVRAYEVTTPCDPSVPALWGQQYKINLNTSNCTEGSTPSDPRVQRTRGSDTCDPHVPRHAFGHLRDP